MNETNISNWTVDSSHERSFLTPATYHAVDRSLISICNKLPPESPPKTPQKTRTHRPSASYHSSIEDLNNNQNDDQNSNNNNCNTYEAKQIESDHENQDHNIQSSQEEKHIQTLQSGETLHEYSTHQQHNIASPITTITETYVHPFDRKEYGLIDDAKDVETAEIDSMTMTITSSTTNTDTKHSRTPLIQQTLNDTMDYTSKLMATIQQMEEQNHLKYKLRKYALKIKKLERQLIDEKAINESKSTFVDKINGELTQTNAEIERIERQKRNLSESLKTLEDVEQQKRLLEMKNLQLIQQHNIKDLEIDKLNKEIIQSNTKLQRTLEDRDNISVVSEAMREELTNKRASITRYKEIHKKLNNKLAKYELNEKKLSDTMCTAYTAPDATRLYTKMNDFERDTILAQKVQDLEEKYNTQSREFMQLKLENQSLKHKYTNISEKLKIETNIKNKLLNELQRMKTKYDSNAKQMQKEIISKNADIERVKSAMFHLNKFIANQGGTKPQMTQKKHEDERDNMEIMKNRMNMTSLSFEHDLDLEGADNVSNAECESTKSNIVLSKKKYKKTLKTKYTKTSSSGDLLDDITAIVANQKRVKNKGMRTKYTKQSKYTKNRRQFIPTVNKDSKHGSRARRIALSKKKHSMNSNIRSNTSGVVQLASV